MALPNINVYSVDAERIILNWKAKDYDTVVSYNLYACDTYDGTYTLVMGNVPNHADPFTPGSVMVNLSREQLSIGPDEPYFFKITSIAPNGDESDVEDSDFVSVDALDDIYKERLTDNYNPVYKSIQVTISEEDQFVDVERILGRKANFAIITPTADITVKFNSAKNDEVSIYQDIATQFDRQALVISSIYLNGTGDVEIFVSGL